jgi:hypothetical protein
MGGLLSFYLSIQLMNSLLQHLNERLCLIAATGSAAGKKSLTGAIQRR